jgi:hypothetical protein
MDRSEGEEPGYPPARKEDREEEIRNLPYLGNFRENPSHNPSQAAKCDSNSDAGYFLPDAQA